MAATDHKELDRRCFEEVWTLGNLAAIDHFYAPTYVGHHPPNEDIHGRDGIRLQVQRTHAAYSDVRYTVEDQLAEGNRTLTRWKMTGTPRKPLHGVAPTGRAVTITGLTLMRYTNGRMQEEWTYWDQLGLQHQLRANR
jgi:steroid delta-isomerase-like uncharacterized protein